MAFAGTRSKVCRGRFDFSGVRSMIEAAKDEGLRVIWDICHYEWPYDINIYKPVFVERMAQYTEAFVRFHLELTGITPWIAPVNEISFFAWAGGQVAMINPSSRFKGDELKAQLVRATIASIEDVWAADRGTRIVHTDPLINMVGEQTCAKSCFRLAVGLGAIRSGEEVFMSEFLASSRRRVWNGR